MSIEGQLTIQLKLNNAAMQCVITSSRPLHASRIFIGKPIDDVLKTIPILFNICGKAQGIAALRATESALQQEVALVIEQQREALIWLESLREQTGRILLDWPKSIHETIDSQLMPSIMQTINAITQALIDQNPSLLSRSPLLKSVKPVTQHKTWQQLKQQIEHSLLGASSQLWLDSSFDIDTWAQGKHTLSARFIDWLQQQTWRNAGSSSLTSLNHWDEAQLQQRLNNDEFKLTRTPDWQGSCYEVSGFSLQTDHPLVAHWLEQQGNGIYTRMIARLVGVADLIQNLDGFFSGSIQTLSYTANNGIAHVNAARGRLTHRVQLNANNKTVKRFTILAPTEWNFHPNGVAAKSLENLQGTDRVTLEQQAHCLIHAIDPCVGYRLTIFS